MNKIQTTDKQNIIEVLRKNGFCTYVRSLTNQINAVIHSHMSDSIGHTWPSCVVDDLHAERVGEQSQSFQVQGVIQTSLSSSLRLV